MHGRALLVVLAVSSAANAAPRAKHHHEETAATAPAAPPATRPPPGPQDARALAILDRIAKGPDAASRKAAVAELDKLAPEVIDGLGTFLARTHTASIEERRQVLEAIHAAVPDEKGHFKAYTRKSAKEEKADDDLDWLASLLALDPAPPGLGEVIADDAAIRALASTRDIHAAALLFDAGFEAETTVYRDEVGRYLRKMDPYSVPALIQQSQKRHDYDRKRYANYQLERIDRQEPGKALAAATGDEALMLAILDAYKVTHYREAVHAVWDKVDVDSPRVRAKAREVWLSYVTGPPPRPAPKKQLLMPGGKLTKKKKPLWLTYRELADNELRKTSNELLHTDYPMIPDPALDDSDADDRHPKKKKFHIDLKKVTDQLFAYYDDQRAKRESAEWADAKVLADKGDLAAATTALDRLLAANPERGEKPAMAAVYMRWAKQLEGKKQWSDAAGAYSKAYGLDPKGAHATDALAAQYFTLGKALEAQGKDGGPDFRRAIALRPDYAPAKTAEHVAASRAHPRPVWMLYAAAGAGVVALFLLVAGVVRRRA